MNLKEFAEILDGREYREEITKKEEAVAKENNFVVAFGASDDLLEFRGAVRDEIGAWKGGTAYFNKKGLLENKCEYDDCPYFEKEKEKSVKVNSVWDPDELHCASWLVEIEIPHETFDIFEDGEIYCRGIVFSLDDIPVME